VADMRPTATLRGKIYRVADLTARQRIIQELKYLQLQGAISRLAGEMKACRDEDRPAKQSEFEKACDDFQIMSVDLVLEGVPRDVSVSLSEAEMAGLESLLEHWRNTKIPAEAMLGERKQAAGQQKAAQ